MSILRKPEKYGDKNPAWKGNDVGYDGVHAWVRRNFPKPNQCQNCGKSKRLALANIRNIYERDFKNWKYLCYSCHIKFDYENGIRKPLSGESSPLFGKSSPMLGKKHTQIAIEKMRLAKLKEKVEKRKGWNGKCGICGSNETYVKIDGYEDWIYIDKNLIMCSKCYGKIYRQSKAGKKKIDEWFESHAEQLHEYNIAYQQKNKEKIHEQKAKYYHINKERIREQQAKYRQKKKLLINAVA